MILKRLIFLAPPIATIAIVLSLAVSDTAYGSFRPELNVEIADPSVNIPSDWLLEFRLPDGDVNFAGAVDFIPGDWGVIDGRDVPVGAVAGVQRAEATLGLINSACNQALLVEFTMLNASLDQSDTVSFEDLDDSMTDDFAEDNDGNGIIDAVDHWPEFIFRTLENTEEVPIQRSAGLSIVAGTPVLLQFLIFPPGTFIDENIANDESLGYPVVILLQDIGDPEIVPAPSPITDFCTPLSAVNTWFGVTEDNEDTPDVDEGGHPLFANPLEGTYTFVSASPALRDADGDSYENSLDTCALEVNVGNPRINNDGDLDGDGLDAACDPNDDPTGGGTNSDQDGDGYLNRQDNCPLISNGEDTTNQRDVDEDGIGDVCDPNPDDPDTEGELIVEVASSEVTIGGGGAGGPADCSALQDASAFPNVVQPAPDCWDSSSPPSNEDESADDGRTDAPPDGPAEAAGGASDDSSNTALVVGIFAGAIAVLFAVGGGTAFIARRRRGA